jgi:diguanylate cyclase (GGDEF)-like protein
MISIRKLMLEVNGSNSRSALAGWRASLAAFGDSASRAIPSLGDELKQKLASAQRALGSSPSEGSLAATSALIEKELAAWATQAHQHHVSTLQEIRKIIGTVVQTGNSAAQRDENCMRQFGEFNGKLHAIAELGSLPLMRQSVLESTRTLKTFIEQMAEDSRESLRQLGGQVAEYRARLEEAEHVSHTDPLTQLPNRRAFERKLNACIAAREDFTLILIDLNGFKAINDKHGHLAGDDLLRQFSSELKNQFRSGDLLARWGGDEFAAIVGADLSESRERVQRIRQWTLGKYHIQSCNHTVHVELSAGIGLAQWNRSESSVELIERTDAALYAHKIRR